MFNNVWEKVVSWFDSDRYKDKEEVYYLELAKAILVIQEMDKVDDLGLPSEDEDMRDWTRELGNASTEFLKEEPKKYGTNSWTEDSVGKMTFIQNMYKSIEHLKTTEDVARHLIMKLEEQAHKLHDNVDYKEQKGKKLFELEKQLKIEHNKRKALIHELREYKEQRYRDMKENMSEERLGNLAQNRELLYGVFANEEIFKERIFDWIKDCMNTDSSRLVECGSDLATRCEDIAQETISEDMCSTDTVWDIAREVVDETDFHDIAYDHDIPNKDEVRELIGEDFKEHLDDYIDTDTPTEMAIETIQTEVKTQLLNFLRLLTNDLSQKGPAKLEHNPTTDKAITVTEEKEETN